jgi:hypothetical protein
MVKASRIEPIEQATRRSWQQWLAFLEGIDAHNLDHAEIARAVQADLGDAIDSAAWWAQSVTVAYEQHIGRRLPGQRSDGTFQTSVSRATKLGMPELMDAWVAFAANDPTVMNSIAGEPRVSGTEKRITWRAKAVDGSSMVVTSEPKKNGSATIVATQTGLTSHERNLDAKETWAKVLGRFLDGL